MTATTIFHLVGWVGTLLYVYGYLLVVLGIKPTRRHYFSVNSLAAFSVIVVSLFTGTHQIVFANVAWLAISIAGLRHLQLNLPMGVRHGMRGCGAIWLLATIGVLIVAGSSEAIAVLAWFGAAAFIGSYFLFANERISVVEFIVWNIVAPVALMPRLYEDANWPVFALEIFWAAVGIFALITRRYHNLAPFREQPGS